MKTILTFLLAICCLTVSANVAIPAKKLFKDAEIRSIEIGPNGKYLSRYLNQEKKYIFQITDIKSNISHNLTFLKAGNSYLKSYQWIDEDTLFMSYVIYNNPQTAFMHINFDGSKFTFDSVAKKVDGYIVDPLVDQQDKVLFAKEHFRAGTFYKLYLASPEQLEKNTLSDDDLYSYQLDESKLYIAEPASKTLMAVKFDDDVFSYWYFNNNTKQWLEFFELKQEKYDFTPIGFIDDNTLAVLSDYNSDLIALHEFKIKEKAFGELIYQHSKYDLTGAIIDPNNNRVESVLFHDHGRLVSHYLTYEGSKLNQKLLDTFKGKQLFIDSASNNSNYKIVSVFSSDSPTSYYLYSTENNSAKLLGKQYKSLNNYELVKSEVFSVKTKDNTDIEAIFTQPKSYNNGTLLVMPHGGPIGVRDYNNFNPILQYFASRGFSVLQVNFRGSTGFGRKFQESGVGEFGKTIESDITLAVNAIRKKHHFSNMCSIGASYGGYSAVMLAIAHPTEYDCVISEFGIYDLPLLFNSTNILSDEKQRKRIENVVGVMRDDLKKFSPFYMAEKIKAPILLIAGKKDRIADFEHANRMKYRLQQVNADLETVFYNQAGHGHARWFGDKNQLAFINDFLARKLQLNQDKLSNAREIIIEDNLLLADGYDSDYYFEPSKELSFKHYKIAAEHGDPRAQFNIGSYYHRGEVVKYDLAQAEQWYLKATSSDYASAYNRLGQIYSSNKLRPADYKKAYAMFEAADKQGHEFAFLQVAKLQCLGSHGVKAFDKCLATLMLDDKKNNRNRAEYDDLRDKRAKTLSEIIWQHHFSADELAQLKKLLGKLYKVDEFSPTLEVISEGVYTKHGRHDDTTSIVPISKDAKFGAILELKSNSNKSKGLVKVKWTVPTVFDDKQNPREDVEYISWNNIDSQSRFFYNLNQDWEQIEGNWTLEIYNLDDKLLYKKTFITKQINP